MKTCARCSAPIDDYVWWCWWCEAPLCSKCGGEIGHCGHAEAEKVSEESTTKDQDGRRRIACSLLDRLGKRPQ